MTTLSKIFKCYSTVFCKKKSTWQVLNIYFHPLNAKFTTWRQILNRTMFFFFSPDIMALEPSFDVPIVNITVVAGKTAVLPCSIDSLGDFKVSQISVKYTATCKIVIYIASSAEWNVKVAYSTFSFNFNDLNNCTISSKLKFKRSLLYIPHWFDTLSKIFQHCSRF